MKRKSAKKIRKNNRLAQLLRRRRLLCESLEDRRLLAVVVWSEGFETDGNVTDPDAWVRLKIK